MADRQQQYRGKKATMPVLLEGELGFCTDAKELYIGTATGNLLVASGEFATAVDTLNTELSTVKTTLSGKLTANQAVAVEALSATATLEEAVAGINAVITNLKAAGIMK